MREGRFAFLVSRKFVLFAALMFCSLSALHVWSTIDVEARNIATYSDTVSDSAPSAYADHTINFILNADVSPGGYIDFIPPTGFTVSATSSFGARNVELLVNGTPRTSSSTGNATTDTVSITTGSPGLVRYTLNPSSGITSGDELTLKIGSNTSNAYNGEETYSSTTGTTTLPQDVGVRNSASTGLHKYTLSVYDGGLVASASFVVFLLTPVLVGPVDTTEEIPPVRFNGAPTGDVGGTTLSVEMSLETDEFATCKYSTVASTSYAAMTNTFESTGLLVHTQLLSGLANDTTYTFYVRCIDDEGNFNIDDYIITFDILAVPDGDPNTTGTTTGDGSGNNETGSGGSGSNTGSGGSGSGSGGSSSGGGGSSSGGGGGGGGSGGGDGGDSGNTAGGGFEGSDAPYRSGDGQVIINGYAFPGSTVTILVDGQITGTARAGNNGKFTYTIRDIARGVYTFGVYATDDNDVKSTTFSTSFSVQGARTSSLSNVNIMPTILVEPDPAEIGDLVTVTGFSIPDATITILHQKDDNSPSLKTYTTTSDGDGEWSITVDTTGFSQGTYKVKAKAEQDGGVETGFSDDTYYGVGQEADRQINADLNRDGSVNLVDFSILLFWWGTDGGASDPPADINGDGNVSLTDFSIMLFQWTG